MTFGQLLRIVISQTFDLYRPIKVDLEDNLIYKDIREVVVDKGFVILRIKKEKKE